MEEEAVYCKNCNNKTAKEALICPKCGAYITNDEEEKENEDRIDFN